MPICHYCPATTGSSALAQITLHERLREKVRRGMALTRRHGREKLRRFRTYHVAPTYFDDMRAAAAAARRCARLCRDPSERRHYVVIAHYLNNEHECNVTGLLSTPKIIP